MNTTVEGNSVALANHRLVLLQFSFTNENVVPASVREMRTEDEKALCDRLGRKPSGILTIEPTEGCSAIDILDDLESSGYQLVDAFYQERLDSKDKDRNNTFFMVRFIFAQEEHAKVSGEFLQVRDDVRAELVKMCREALWRALAYSNPFYEKGEEVEGVRVISVNFAARKSLFQPSGQPVLVWQKDENKLRVGDAPVPIPPACQLRVDLENKALVLN